MKIKIMIAAAKIRMSQGMALDAILTGWPRLTEEEKAEIRKACRL